MNDIEKALADELEQHGLDFWVDVTEDDERQGVKEMDFDYDALAAFILATPQMQAIARQAAIGAVVERLPEMVRVQRRGARWQAFRFANEFDMDRGKWQDVGAGDTLDDALRAAAIKEALR